MGADITFRIGNSTSKLTSWAESTFGALKARIKESERKLRATQRCPLDLNMRNNYRVLSNELDELHRMEESYWYMRSRANEFIDGDKNSKHFHHKACSRRCRNLIKGLNDENGCWKTSKSDIERLITAYYESLFSTSSPSGFDNAVDGLGAIVTADMNDFLDTEPTTEEIRSATFQMHRTKAPGIDGFHALFYQNFGILLVMMWFVLLNDGGEVYSIGSVLIKHVSPSSRSARNQNHLKILDLLVAAM